VKERGSRRRTRGAQRSQIGASKPTYASEGVADGGGEPDRNFGDLRGGGPNDEANHCWVFAEFALLHDGNRTGGEWLSIVEADASRLKRLGWKKSAALLVVVGVSRGEAWTERADLLAGRAVWNQPALPDPFVIPLPGGGTVVVKAFDIKCDPADTLIPAARLVPGSSAATCPEKSARASESGLDRSSPFGCRCRA
jgi:hypothetical protein